MPHAVAVCLFSVQLRGTAMHQYPSMFAHAKEDTVAGIVVFLVALPLCLGIAIASGVPPVSGLVAGVITASLSSWLCGVPSVASSRWGPPRVTRTTRSRSRLAAPERGVVMPEAVTRAVTRATKAATRNRGRRIPNGTRSTERGLGYDKGRVSAKPRREVGMPVQRKGPRG